MWAYLWHVVEYITIYLVFTTDRCAHMFYIYFLILWDDTNKKIVRTQTALSKCQNKELVKDYNIYAIV